MIPNFALSLSFDGISLLRRMGPKWAKIEEVALDSANLDEGVRGLKTRALSLGPGGARVVLMIPNEQIRYIDLPDLGGDESTRETAIRAALEGATPYAVDDLKFDYALAPGRILVAAVAQDTLNEAEAFARSHGFNPASFAAQAPQGAFDGAVDFGRAPGWKGKEPERLPHAIQIVPANKAALTPVGAKRAKPGPGPKAAAAATPAVQDEPKQVEEPVVETLATPEAEDATPETPAATEAPETDATKAPEIPALRLGPAHRSAPAEPDGDTAEDSDNEAAPPSFSSQRRVPPAPKPISADAPMGRPEPKLSARKARFTPVVTPDSTARESNVNSGDLDAPDTTSGFGARANAVLDAMSRRRQKAQAPTQSDDAPETSKPALPKAPDAPAHARVEIPIPPKPPKEPAPSPLSELTARRLAQQPAESAPADGLALQSERERMTVFGARGDTAIGGKPKYLGLMLTSALLLFLVGVAAWASVFLDDGLASLFSRDEPDVAAVELPDEDSPTLPTLAPEPAPAAVPEPEVELAALDDGQVTEDVPQALAQPQLPQAMTEEEAAATYAATGIWQRAPAAPQEPAQSLLNDLYVASIDPGVQQLDAVALPDARGLSQEAALPVPTAPPPAGVVFTLDPRGLVVASPEGTLSPEGHRVYAGLPPVVPPLRDPVP
ncbi:MAG: hypothetical protein QNJ09_08740, partial [Paracoccaceae bacterium]|nr:hypothetical protein [Paracoccaceae bacterium]